MSEQKYDVKAIPEELKVGVNAVVREDFTTFTIRSQSKATLNIHYVVTILNEKGKEFASCTIGYDKLSKINSFKGTTYTEDGSVIKKLKGSEIYDQVAYDGFSLYSDNRLKHADLSYGSYPYTVEFDYEIEYKFLFFIPESHLLPKERVSVEKFSYTLNYPASLKPRHKTFHLSDPKESVMPNGTTEKKWEATNVKPVITEPFGPSLSELTPKIVAAPGLFEYDGYSGSMESWEEFGKWIVALNKGRGSLSDETKAKARKLTSGVSSTEEKVKILYEYLQNRTRYVSIQLGIGGYQPFEASVVDETGYGDCKALSNYMVALLDAIEIPSHYTLISAGENEAPMDTDFPSSQFNHTVVNVPNGVDTLWLECTSQTNPFGYMGTFTGNREALAITNDGAAIVKTPRYTVDDNLQTRKAEVTVHANGDAYAKVNTLYAGLQFENRNLNSLQEGRLDEQKKWLQKNIDIPAFEINSFQISSQKNKMPTSTVEVDLALRRYAQVSGKRMFLSLNLMNKNEYIPENIEDRKHKVIKRLAFNDTDTIKYLIPEDLYPEFLPAPVKMDTRFGEYESSVSIEQGAIVYSRKLKMVSGEFPAESYSELVEFYREINKADKVKIVFLTKT